MVGFDVERHQYGAARYPATLVLQDVRTIHGSQLRDAALIVASPPCQEYSYRAMPWRRAKALPPPSNELFEACFRIRAEASAAAGRWIPLVVENVRGAQPYVGRARWHFGSYFLWGDVPALMPNTRSPVKVSNQINKRNGADHTRHLMNQAEHDGIKGPNGGWFNDLKRQGRGATGYLSQPGSNTRARKIAAAQVAKIPIVLARHIARAWYPTADVLEEARDRSRAPFEAETP